MISSNELLALSRLALSGKESDVRLYLAKMVRKLRKVDSKLGSDIEALLKSQPARSGGVLRRDIRKDEDGLFEPNSDSAIPLLKSFDNSFSGEEPLLDRNLKQTLDNILEGPLRELLKQYFDLEEFGSNAREESLYFIILFFGIFQIVISLQNLFQPVIELKNGKIAIKTKQKILSVIKPVNEIIEVTESEDFTLTFVFQDSSYNVISKHLENNELNLILNEIRRENSP